MWGSLEGRVSAGLRSHRMFTVSLCRQSGATHSALRDLCVYMTMTFATTDSKINSIFVYGVKFCTIWVPTKSYYKHNIFSRFSHLRMFPTKTTRGLYFPDLRQKAIYKHFGKKNFGIQLRSRSYFLSVWDKLYIVTLGGRQQLRASYSSSLALKIHKSD